MRRAQPYAILAVLALLAVAGQVARDRMGVEFSSESIQAWVASLGWKGPAAYVLLVTFRHALFLPSMIVLPAGGVCFGAGYGALLGGAGISLTGLSEFAVMRAVRPEWVLRRLGEPARRFSGAIERAGAWVVAVGTAHPASPMSVFHWGAGLTTMPVIGFTFALLAGALARAFAYAFFGSTLLDPGSPRFYLAGLVLVGAFLLPLAHPGLRRRLLGTDASTTASGA